MKEIGCFVFDIDDTLYLERDYVRSGFRAVGDWVQGHLQIDHFSDLCWSAFDNGHRGSIFDLVLQRCGVETGPDLIGRLVEVYRTHAPKIDLTADSRTCLEGLHGRTQLACVTDGPIVSQRAKVEALGLPRWIHQIVFTEGLGPGFGKPSSKPFQLLEESARCSAWQCAYIADNPAKDFSGPKSLGWRTVRVRRPQSLHRDRDSGHDVDIEVPDLADWHRVLQRLAAVKPGLRQSL